MIKQIFAVFLVLHGLVHLLYLTLSQGIIEDETIHWTMESWLWKETSNSIKLLALVLFGISILTFVITGVLHSLEMDFWLMLTYIACLISTVTFILFWDGTTRSLPDQGFVGILINIGIVGIVKFYEPIMIS